MSELEKIEDELGAYICDCLCGEIKKATSEEDAKTICDNCKIDEFFKRIENAK